MALYLPLPDSNRVDVSAWMNRSEPVSMLLACANFGWWQCFSPFSVIQKEHSLPICSDRAISHPLFILNSLCHYIEIK